MQFTEQTVLNSGHGIAVLAAIAAWAAPAAAIVTVVWLGLNIIEKFIGRPFATTRFARWVVRKFGGRPE
jgi:hypothetical protein